MLEGQDHLNNLSQRYGIVPEDILLIALNISGVDSELDYPRARFRLRLISRPEETFYIIVSLGRKTSPFYLTNDQILFKGEPVAYVEELENDDVVVSYFRNNRKLLTLNTNARSHCTGCVFCYNTLETTSDPRLRIFDDLNNYALLLKGELGWSDLSSLEEVTVCTGCFQSERPAIDHLALVREVFKQHGFDGQIGILSSVIRSGEGLDQIAKGVAPFHLTLTIECFTNRGVILKDSKACIDLEQMLQILSQAKSRGFETDFTYIIGLDPADVALDGLRRLKSSVTQFPRIQLFQPHNVFMQTFASKPATQIDYFLGLRKDIEAIFEDTGLRPKSYQNYRPMWYFTFANEELTGTRI